MKVLVIGSGGREHALCWAINKSPKCKKLYCAPGNAGISEIAECIEIASNNIPELLHFSIETKIDLVVIGPEDVLVGGLSDELRKNQIKCFGPSSRAAHLEGSKGFMKDFFKKYNIPTAEYGRFSNYQDALSYVKKKGLPIVVKASGLAAGKGVILCEDLQQASDALYDMLENRSFGDAGKEVVVEELLEGEEVSFFALVNGQKAIPLLSAQDHKAAYDGDRGPNTGGMGAYTPAPIIDDNFTQEIMKNIIQPTINGMVSEDRRFEGLLYAGLMITNDGPKVLEYNVRFGDPECQVLMALLDTDALILFENVASNKIDKISLKWKKQSALVVVMASKGYPVKYENGSLIKGLTEIKQSKNTIVFHAATKLVGNQFFANGGRVLCVTGLGDNIEEAQENAYSSVKKIIWKEGFYRNDIGWRALKRGPDKS